MMSHRLTDIVSVHGQFLDKFVAGRDLLSEIAVGENNFFRSITEQVPEVLQICPLGNDFRPFNQLPMYPESILIYFAV